MEVAAAGNHDMSTVSLGSRGGTAETAAVGVASAAAVAAAVVTVAAVAAVVVVAARLVAESVEESYVPSGDGTRPEAARSSRTMSTRERWSEPPVRMEMFRTAPEEWASRTERMVRMGEVGVRASMSALVETY